MEDRPLVTVAGEDVYTTPTLKEKGKSAQLQVGYISDFLTS